ncbi:CDP-alcohol phosphatidyltransferase family protein (plasmid) [Aggregatilineales bacterium SYSU G02658]
MTGTPLTENRAARWLAWGVHAYTALGGVLGVFALMLAGLNLVREAYVLLILQMVIDATDGLIARRLRVREVLPHFDGAMLDNVIDILTYAWVPFFIILNEQLLPHPLWIVPGVLAALYAYGQANMKTDDGYFIGFPTYWNVIALYLYWLRPADGIAVLFVLVPSVLSFVPTRYLYPSKGEVLWRTAWTLGALWLALVLYLLSQPAPPLELILISGLFPLWYMVASFIVDWRIRTGRMT